MHVQRHSTLKDIAFGFSNRENEVTQCEGILKPHFKPQLYRSPGRRGQQLLISAWLQAQRCTVPASARWSCHPWQRSPEAFAFCVLQICVAEPCSCLKPESLKAGGQTQFFQETPRIRPSFAARVTYPISEIPWSPPRKQNKISSSGFIHELKCQMFVLWMFQMSFISRRKEAIMSSQETRFALSTSISSLPTPFQLPTYFPVKCHSSLVLQA